MIRYEDYSPFPEEGEITYQNAVIENQIVRSVVDALFGWERGFISLQALSWILPLDKSISPLRKGEGPNTVGASVRIFREKMILPSLKAFIAAGQLRVREADTKGIIPPLAVPEPLALSAVSVDDLKAWLTTTGREPPLIFSMRRGSTLTGSRQCSCRFGMHCQF